MEHPTSDSGSAGGVAPGPAGGELEAVFQELRSDTLSAHMRLFQTYGDVARVQLGPFLNHFLFHPEHVKHVLVTASDLFDKETYGNRRLRSFTGQGLLFSDGATWQRQRKLTQPLLASREHDQFALAARDALLAQLPTWQDAATAAGVIDVQELVGRAMFVGIMRALISRELSQPEAIELRWALVTLLAESQRTSVPKVRVGENSNATDDFSRASALMDGTILDSIRQREREAEQPDFLSRLVARAKAEQMPFSEEELLAQVKTMLLAGHDSAAQTIVFALYFLSQNLEIQATLREEARWLTDSAPLSVTAARMKQTEAVVQETLRLLPPVWAIERRALCDNEVLGCTIPKGSSVILSPYVTQRHPQFWDAPNDFKPERFLANTPLSHRNAYLPFGSGPRICVGNNVALLQIKVALGTILNQFRFTLSPDFKYELNPLVVVRFRHGLPLKLAAVE